MPAHDQGLPPGLYELLITSRLQDHLANIDQRLVQRSPLDSAEAPDRIAFHLAREVVRALSSIGDEERVEVGVAAARALLQRLAEIAPHVELSEQPLIDAEVLHAVSGLQVDGSPRPIDRPLIPLLDTTLLTNAPGEPRVGRQVEAEIDSADRVDLLMAFIRNSGIRPLANALRRFHDSGRQLRVLTTTYTGSTQRSALDLLASLGAQIRVSYDRTSTRLHAKAWLFHRKSGFSTAYVGSSNLTHSAQVTGLEWNVRIAGARNPDVIDKIRAVFDTYWANPDFRDYDPEEFEAQVEEPSFRRFEVHLSPVAVMPLPFQERLLEQLTLSRAAGHHRNLLVSATGTGKTVMAALDYARLRPSLGVGRLLFVAHREQILAQTQATFAQVLREPDFGERWVAGDRPHDFDHVFASIQSLNAADLTHLPRDHFDMVIVDEFHHAAAASYDRLLSRLQPDELLGLTATPERSDGLPIRHWFGDRIAAELRLWDAITQHYLVPFAYYGIHDGLDLTQVAWRRGAGYDVDELTSLYTASDIWAGQVVKAFLERVDDVQTVRCIGFCVSVAHARYMTQFFNQAGIAAETLSADTSPPRRQAIMRAFRDGGVRVIFSVDLLNEGIDVPDVDTLLMLRPTESPTVFLQQLGRGLRKGPGKSVCTVLDFVGNHRREFRFDRTLTALLGGNRRDVEQQVHEGFPYLPAGCHMELDRKASEVVLSSLRTAIPDRWPEKVAELISIHSAGEDVSLANYLELTGLDLDDLYSATRGWSELCEAAGLKVAPPGPHEERLRRAIGRLRHVDDLRRIDFYCLLLNSNGPSLSDFPLEEQRLARMLLAQLVDQVPPPTLGKAAPIQEALALVRQHPQVCAEATELLGVLRGRMSHVHEPIPGRTDVPLRIHARYTRLEILAGLGHGNPSYARVPTWQTGVLDVGSAAADVLAFTLDKSHGTFSPTTRYRDYAISRDLIHWESQAGTREDSEPGRRYQRHRAMDRDVLLFARLRQDDRAFWFLGPATYVSHEGERPMAITWRLTFPLPGDLFAEFAAAVA